MAPLVWWVDVVAWVLGPLAFAAGCWAILLMPELIARLLPWPLQPELTNEEAALVSATNGEAASLLNRSRSSAPLTPEEKTLVPPSQYSAWVAGRAAGRLEAPEASVDEQIQDVAEAIGISVDRLDRETVIHLGDLIQVAERRPFWESLQPVRSLFTVINCLWFIAIMGLALTVLPFLAIVAGPLMQWIVEHILVPLYNFLAQFEVVWEVCAFLACLYLTALSLCFRRGVREWVALSGVALSTAAYSYMTDDLVVVLPSDLTASWFYAYLTLALIPLGRQFASELLGFFAAVALFGTLNSRLLPSITGAVLKHWDASYVGGITVSGSAFLLASLLVLLKIFRTERLYGPYRLGLFLFGPVLFYATWLMLASYWVAPWKHLFWLKYALTNGLLVLIITGAGLLGKASDSKWLTNTSITFGVLLLFTKVVDASAWFGDGANTVAAFFAFASMWLAAWFLKNNPMWARSLLP